MSKFPPKEKHRLIVLREIAKHLKDGHKYSKKELNQTLKDIYNDYVLVRRYLIEYGFQPDGSQYWEK